MTDALPPQHSKILVVGGGPAGSYSAAALAREGYEVVLLEAAKFPRYHIGESLIPSVRHYLRFIDAEDKLANSGFARKPGSAIKFNQFKKEGYTDFVALGHDNNAWNVIRSEFDQLLLQHAASCGVQVFENTKVVSLSFEPSPDTSEDGGPLGRPISATYVKFHESRDGASRTGTISFDYLIDATGRAGLMCTKYLKNRRVNESLKNVAVWGYWRNTGVYAPGTGRENAPWFEALTDESGWAWFIPLHNGLTSVGIVTDKRVARVAPESEPRTPRQRAASTASSSLLNTPTSPTSPTGLDSGALPSPATPSKGRFGWSRRSTVSYLSSSLPSLPLIPRRSLTAPYPSPPASPAAFRSSASRRSLSISVPQSPVLPGTPRTPTTAQSMPLTPTTPCTSMFGEGRGLTARYLALLKLAPGVENLIGDGELVGPGEDDELPNSTQGTAMGGVKTASDFSYSGSTYAGEGWRVAGDAGAFIDPFFSSGIHLAMTGALSAAATISASIRGDCQESKAAEWHDLRVGMSYTRFLIVVLSAYKQIRAQSMDVLADVDEDNFDRAFAFLRPVIQGAGDVGPHLSPTELENALDFCVKLFNPTTPEQHAEVSNLLSSILLTSVERGESGKPDVLDVNAPVVDPQILGKLVEDLSMRDRASTWQSPMNDSHTDKLKLDVKMVLDKVNARRVIHGEHSGIGCFEHEALVDGLVARLVRGELGLKKVGNTAEERGV